jgi:(p)ppGpp synthase/HD superfamily hydrolase
MTLTPRFSAALVLASELHGDQFRKGTSVPYISHLLGVTALVLEHGGDEDAAIVALLHDAVEDQGGQATLARISEQFGARVADAVLECSDTDVVPKPPWKERKEAYIASIAHKSDIAALVSLADKVHNAKTIAVDVRSSGAAVWNRFRAGRDGTLWYYRSLALEFEKRWPSPLSQMLDAAVGEMESLAD